MAELTLKQRMETLDREIDLDHHLWIQVYSEFGFNSRQEIKGKIKEIKNDMLNNVEYAVGILKFHETLLKDAHMFDQIRRVAQF